MSVVGKGPEIDKSALIIVDMQNDFLHRDHLVARISWAERLGLGSVEDHFPFGERDFAGR
jgi:hypothetical protein